MSEIAKIIKKGDRRLLVIDITDNDMFHELCHRFNAGFDHILKVSNEEDYPVPSADKSHIVWSILDDESDRKK